MIDGPNILRECIMTISKEKILEEIGPVAEILKEHDGIVNVVDTTDGNIMISLEGGCIGCSSTPMTAMQMYYHLKQLEEVNDVIFINGELPDFMRMFIDEKMEREAEAEAEDAEAEAEGAKAETEAA